MNSKNNFLENIGDKNLRIGFYCIWIIITIIQAYFTELMDDEAFYWVYGENLDWGNYHHPPMVGLLCKMGYFISESAFGVRFFFILMHLATIWLIEELIDHKNTSIFITLFASVGILHIGGFLAVPDTPFIFFTALFLYLTKKYLEKDSLTLALALGVSIAGMLYSKYNAVVIVFFAIIANWQLFRRWTFYVAGFFGLILFLPHLYWELQNDFVTFQFHWTERNKMKWHIGLTLTYIIASFVILGPLVSFLMFKEMLVFRSKSAFHKTLKYVGFGLLGFFLVMSFKGRTEANWVVGALIPMLVLSVESLQTKSNARKWLNWIFPISLVIALVARFVIMVDILPKEQYNFQKLRDFHSVEDVIQPIAEAIVKEGDYPPIFAGSYQLPSKYSFYTGKFSTALAASTASRTQFDFYYWEQDFIGDTVLYFSKYPMYPCTDSLETGSGTYYYRKITDFRAYSTVELETETKEFIFPKDSLVSIPIKFNIPENVTFEGDSVSRLTAQIFYYNKFIGHQVDELPIVKMDKSKVYDFYFRTPKEAGKYRMNISIQAKDIFTTHNTPRLNLLIE